MFPPSPEKVIPGLTRVSFARWEIKGSEVGKHVLGDDALERTSCRFNQNFQTFVSIMTGNSKKMLHVYA